MNNLNSVKVGDHRLAPRSSAELEIRYNIESLEASLKEKVSNNEFEQTVFAADTPEGDAQVAHFFGDGVYARSLLIPEGTAVVGRLHKQARICIIAKEDAHSLMSFRLVLLKLLGLENLKPELRRQYLHTPILYGWHV